jgi:hypothetical protein
MSRILHRLGDDCTGFSCMRTGQLRNLDVFRMVLQDDRALHGTMTSIFTKGMQSFRGSKWTLYMHHTVDSENTLSPGTKSPDSRDTDVDDLKTNASWDEDECMAQSETQATL